MTVLAEGSSLNVGSSCRITTSQRASPSPSDVQAPRGRDRLRLCFRPLPGLLRVLEAVGRRAHFGLAAKHGPFAAPNHNPAAVMRAKIQELQRPTRSRVRCWPLIAQPSELVLNGMGRGAEFGRDPAEHEALLLQDQQPLLPLPESNDRNELWKAQQ